MSATDRNAAIIQLVEMGFEEDAALQALEECGNVAAALSQLLGGSASSTRRAASSTRRATSLDAPKLDQRHIMMQYLGSTLETHGFRCTEDPTLKGLGHTVWSKKGLPIATGDEGVDWMSSRKFDWEDPKYKAMWKTHVVGEIVAKDIILRGYTEEGDESFHPEALDHLQDDLESALAALYPEESDDDQNPIGGDANGGDAMEVEAATGGAGVGEGDGLGPVFKKRKADDIEKGGRKEKKFTCPEVLIPLFGKWSNVVKEWEKVIDRLVDAKCLCLPDADSKVIEQSHLLWRFFQGVIEDHVLQDFVDREMRPVRLECVEAIEQYVQDQHFPKEEHGEMIREHLMDKFGLIAFSFFDEN